MKKRHSAGNKVKIQGPFDDIIWDNKDHNAVCVIKNNLKGCVFSDGTIISCVYDDVGPCYDGSLFVNLKGEWLLIDKSENVIQNFGKMEATPLLSLLVVYEDGKCGAINKSGEYIIPVKYQYISTPLRGTRTTFPIFKLTDFDGQITLADSYGKTLTSRKYGGQVGTVSVMNDTFSNECLNGLIDLRDKETLHSIVMFDCHSQKELNEYVPGQEVSDLDEVLRLGGKVFLLHYDGKKQLMDRSGKIIVPFESDYQDFGEVLLGNYEYLFPAKKNGKWGYLNEFGKEKIKCKYDIANSFVRGLAIVGYIDRKTAEHQLGIIDHHDKIIMPFAYTEIKDYGYKGNLFFIKAQKNGSDSFRVYSSDGSEYELDCDTFILDNRICTFWSGKIMTVEEKEKDLYNFWKGDYWTIKQVNDKYGICDETDHYVVNPIFDYIVEHGDIYCVWLDDMKYTITKTNGKSYIKR